VRRGTARVLELELKVLGHKELVLGGLQLLLQGTDNLRPALLGILLHGGAIPHLIELGESPLQKLCGGGGKMPIW